MAKAIKVQGQASAVEIEGLAAILAEKQAALKAAKQGNKLADWEAKTKARNPQYVMGSVRKSETVSSGKHGHGEVCDITCVVCGAVRTVNKQDAFQVRYCLEHKGEGKKVAADEKRAVAAANPDKLRAKIAALEAKLAAVKPVGQMTDAEIGDLEIEVTDEQLERLHAAMVA